MSLVGPMIECPPKRGNSRLVGWVLAPLYPSVGLDRRRGGVGGALAAIGFRRRGELARRHAAGIAGDGEECCRQGVGVGLGQRAVRAAVLAHPPTAARWSGPEEGLP